MTTSHPLEGVEISEQLLATPRKRSQFLKGLAAAGVGVAAATAVGPAGAFAAGRLAVPAGDIAILNYALTLEHLEAAFYTQAVAQVPFEQDIVQHLAQTLKKDELTHVDALTATIKQLGGSPVGAANYNFGADTFKTQSGFLKLSYALEDTGVHAYLGQAPNIKTPQILLTAATIVTVEARHAGAIRYQYGLQPTLAPFDEGYSMQQVLAIAGPLIVK